jgi:ABC-type antimicrobial peptide transport system permease subunit
LRTVLNYDEDAAAEDAVSRLRAHTHCLTKRQVLAPQLGGAWLLGGFGGLALVIAVIGIYGVQAYSVERRTREIGIRMAVGARAVDVLRAVALRATLLVLVGLLVGLALGVGLTHGVRSFLFGVPAGDPVTIGVAVGTMLLVGLFAALAPARRAVRIDPSAALRMDG